MATQNQKLIDVVIAEDHPDRLIERRLEACELNDGHRFKCLDWRAELSNRANGASQWDDPYTQGEAIMQLILDNGRCKPFLLIQDCHYSKEPKVCFEGQDLRKEALGLNSCLRKLIKQAKTFDLVPPYHHLFIVSRFLGNLSTSPLARTLEALVIDEAGDFYVDQDHWFGLGDNYQTPDAIGRLCESAVTLANAYIGDRNARRAPSRCMCHGVADRLLRP